MKEDFRALLVERTGDSFAVEVKKLKMADLPEGNVLIRVNYSSVNYKDGLACTPTGSIVKSYPFVPGIDMAGTVVHSTDARFLEGDEVICTGYELGVSHFGGFSEYCRLPADWLMKLPKGLTQKEAMVIGTAGFTAALSILRLQQNGLTPDKGSVLVTGATGGVGSVAVAILYKLRFKVAASTGKSTEHEYLKALGAYQILDREAVTNTSRPLEDEKWAAAVDPVGGKTLSHLLSAIQYGGSVAVSGLTGGIELNTSVYPFLLRGINLLGIDSVYCPMEIRRDLWTRLASDWKPEQLIQQIASEIELEQIPESVNSILKGEVRGRTVVKV